MTVSRLRVAKSETRDLAERDRVQIARRYGIAAESAEWGISNASFFTAFVAILAVLAVFALALR